MWKYRNAIHEINFTILFLILFIDLGNHILNDNFSLKILIKTKIFY